MPSTMPSTGSGASASPNSQWFRSTRRPTCHEFRSESRLVRLYRLLAARPAKEVSAFVYEGGRVTPLTYLLDTGRCGGCGDLRIDFAWEQGIATSVANDVSMTTNLVRGVLDLGSLQVTLMLSGDGAPGTYSLLDEDGLETLGGPGRRRTTDRYSARRFLNPQADPCSG